jgi:predicted dehydrogenase
MRTPLTVGVVGGGRQGLEVAHVLAELPQVRLRWLCDERGELPDRSACRFGEARVTRDPADLFEDESLDAVAIVPGGRPALVWCALAADKHVLTGPPLAHAGGEAAELQRLAHGRRRALVVADPLVAQPAAPKLKELIETGGLGDVYSLYACRQGLPKELPGASGAWTFGAAELSLLLYLLEDEPVEVVARGQSYVERGKVDVVSSDLCFATGITGHLHLSWLDPEPVRRVTVIGSKRMAVFDDLAAERKLTIYPHGSGDVRSPQFDCEDPVRVDCERLLAAARSAGPNPAGGRAVAVVTVLETIDKQLELEPVLPEPVELRPRPDLQVVPLRPA